MMGDDAVPTCAGKSTTMLTTEMTSDMMPTTREAVTRLFCTVGRWKSEMISQGMAMSTSHGMGVRSADGEMIKASEKKSCGKPTVKEYRALALRMPAKSVCETDGCQPYSIRR